MRRTKGKTKLLSKYMKNRIDYWYSVETRKSHSLGPPFQWKTLWNLIDGTSGWDWFSCPHSSQWWILFAMYSLDTIHTVLSFQVNVLFTGLTPGLISGYKYACEIKAGPSRLVYNNFTCTTPQVDGRYHSMISFYFSLFQYDNNINRKRNS